MRTQNQEDLQVKLAIESQTEKEEKHPMAMRKSSTNKYPFLKAEHINPKGETSAKVLSVGYIGDNGYGLKVNFNVQIKGKTFAFGVKPANFAFKTLLNKAIAGKPVMLVVDEYNGNDYVKIVDEEG